MNKDTLLAWIDIETTGLKAEEQQILEVAVVLTDTKLNRVDEFWTLVRPDHMMPMSMDDFVLDMHTKNGLLDAVGRTNVYVGQAEEHLVAFLKKHNAGDNRRIVLCGNSLPAVDLPFLRRHLPAVFDHVHYRTIDVTAMRLGLEVALDIDIPIKKAGGHRARGDVLNCIEEFKQLRAFTNMRLV